MTTAESVEPRRPGRPRSAQLDARIVEAALEELARNGVEGFSVEAVATAAGVGKTTIYRRWRSKDELIVHAVATLDDEMPAPGWGPDARAELVMLIDMIRRRAIHGRTGSILWCVVGSAERHPDLMRQYKDVVVEPRRDRVRAAIRRGIDEGLIRADVDIELALQLLTGPMLARTVMRALEEVKRVPEEFAQQVVDGVLDGLRPR
ncbi:MAG: TetR/AcrR family transcriptional regulator [Actinomycetota bacterium]|nr:TetR/AcrR family transcriptional regulator [Actinomycetota bacterium]